MFGLKVSSFVNSFQILCTEVGEKGRKLYNGGYYTRKYGIIPQRLESELIKFVNKAIAVVNAYYNLSTTPPWVCIIYK